MSESELIKACRHGDTAAITELFERHYPSSLRVARRILRSEEESHDAVQSAYLSAFRNLHRFRGDAAFKTWISRIVTNQCFMRLREAGSRIQCITLDDSAWVSSTAQTPEESTLCGEIASALSDGASKLPKLLSEVFKLYAFSGLSIREVAAATGLTIPAAKTRLFRAQARMRDHLQAVWSSARSAAGHGDNANRRAGELRGKAA